MYPHPFTSTFFFLKHLEPLILLDSEMDAVTTTTRNDTKKRNPIIKMLRVGFYVEGIHLDVRIGDKVELNVEFCLRLPQYA